MQEQPSGDDIGKLIVSAIDQAVTSAFEKRFPLETPSNPPEPLEDTEMPLHDPSEEADTAKVAPSHAHYYLDEAGDPNIFAHKGRVIIGQEGCSRFFMLGLLEAKNPQLLTDEMDRLRAELLADPYFKGVPSLAAEQRKTALLFHAKDDLPEVRREVFRLLLRHELSFAAVLVDKSIVLERFVRPQQVKDPDYQYNPNDQYDYQVKCLSKGRLHKKEAYNIHFAYRGTSERTEALRTALEAELREMNQNWNIAEAPTLNVSVHQPQDLAGLQAVDYFLWALQRLYERGEERFWNLLQPKCSLVNERTDDRKGHGGTFYTRKKPLTLAALKPGLEEKTN